MAIFTSSNDFDPRGIDLKYVERLSQLLPEDGSIDINQAEILATRFLRGADYCIDLVAQASHWREMKASERNEAKALAIAQLVDRGVSGTVALQQFSSNAEYVKKSKELSLAEAWLRWIDLKYRHLMAAHVHCKDVMKRNIQHEHSSGFKGTPVSDSQELDLDSDFSEGSNHKQQYGASNWDDEDK